MLIIIPMALNILFVIIFHFLEKKTKFSKLKHLVKQLIIGVVFGGIAVTASELGLDIVGATMNIRDSAPLSAGLLFGWEAGLIAGVIGGGYRAISILWGGGAYTAIACSISTCMAGIIAALLRKYMFENKKPSWAYACGITVIVEIFHMLMILITNLKDSTTAFGFVRLCTFPMTILNAITVVISVIILNTLSKEQHKRIKDQSKEQLSHTFQRWLVISILITFAITSIFTFYLQTGMRENQIETTFAVTINDVIDDIQDKSDNTITNEAKYIKNSYISNNNISFNDLCNETNISEISVISSNGIVVKSTLNNLVNQNIFEDTNLSTNFSQLINAAKDTTVINDLAIGLDGMSDRKYAGISLSDGGFILIGYSENQYRSNIQSYIVDFTRNRKVGANGFITICDENLNIIAEKESKYNGQYIESIGIIPNEEMLNGIISTDIYKAKVNYKDDNEEYLYVFTFAEEYCVIAAIPNEEAMLIRDASAYLSIYMQVMIYGILFVILYFLIKKLVIDNFNKVNNSLSKISSGDLDEVVQVRSNVEFALLSDDINSTVDTLKRYINEAATRLDKELEYAKQIQLSAIPSVFPHEKEYEIFASMIAAKEVGGDFYDFYKLDNNLIAFLVADVSGKGIPAAMFMMSAKTIIKDLAERGLDVDEIFTTANNKLCENNDSGMFVTAWMGILNIETGILKYVNAGHNPLLLYKDGKYEYIRCRPGLVLACIEGIQYNMNEIKLNKGDKLFLYTDGVTEATNNNEELYGEERLKEFMNLNHETPPTKILPALKEDIDKFVDGALQFDDITMLIFEYNKEDIIVMNQTYKAQVEELNDVIMFFEEILDKYECSMKNKVAITIAIEEVFVNVCHYAYKDTGDVSFKVSFNSTTRELIIEMVDSGVPFNPLGKVDPDITLNADDRQIGGLGIYITKKTMDNITYQYIDDFNILTMNKKI